MIEAMGRKRDRHTKSLFANLDAGRGDPEARVDPKRDEADLLPSGRVQAFQESIGVRPLTQDEMYEACGARNDSDRKKLWRALCALEALGRFCVKSVDGGRFSFREPARPGE